MSSVHTCAQVCKIKSLRELYSALWHSPAKDDTLLCRRHLSLSVHSTSRARLNVMHSHLSQACLITRSSNSGAINGLGPVALKLCITISLQCSVVSFTIGDLNYMSKFLFLPVFFHEVAKFLCDAQCCWTKCTFYLCTIATLFMRRCVFPSFARFYSVVGFRFIWHYPILKNSFRDTYCT